MLRIDGGASSIEPDLGINIKIARELWHPQWRPLQDANKLVMTLTEHGFFEVVRRLQAFGFKSGADATFFEWVRTVGFPGIHKFWCAQTQRGGSNSFHGSVIDVGVSNRSWQPETRTMHFGAASLSGWLLESFGRWFPFTECVEDLSKVGDDSTKLAESLSLLCKSGYLWSYRTAPKAVETEQPSLNDILLEFTHPDSIDGRGFGVLMGALTAYGREELLKEQFGEAFDAIV
ncbi:MAG: hypothetical protein R3C20_16445 [Planctomycetaceae bacterium]